jgi:hypothetical protein
MGRTKAIPGSSFLKGRIGALSGIGLACAVAISWPIILEVVSCSAAYADESKLTSAYPKPENWADLLHQVAAKPGFPVPRLGLDIFRLQAATGGLTKADQYIGFAEMAMQAGLPAEAKAVLDKGYAAGVLGTGPEADRHGRLRDTVKHELEANQLGLANAETEAGKQPIGNALVAAGINAYGYGQYDKAINLIQAGIAKGGLANPDDAKLHFGIVELAAGKEGQGVATLKSITSGNAVNEIARLWLIKTTGHHQ